EAWATSGAAARGIPLRMIDDAAEIECDRQAMGEALQHLLGEAVARTPDGGAIAVRGGRRCLEIAVPPAGMPAREQAGGPAISSGAPADRLAAPTAGGGLRLIFARSLLEMQGATLSLGAGSREGRAEGWTARIAFPAAAGGHRRWRQSGGW